MSRSTKDAEKVLRRFLEAGMKRDEKAMRACLTQSSQAAGKFDHYAAPPDGTVFSFGEAVEESATTLVIPVLATTGGAPPEVDASPVMQCVMVNENGDWKVDLATTMDRMMGGVIEQVAEKMGTAVSTMTHAVGAALAEAFESADGARSDWSAAELSPRAEELLELPKMTALPGLTKAFSEALGSKVLVMAADDLLGVGGKEGRQTLIDWFEGPLFHLWPDLLRRADETLSIKGRLRAVRLEYASWFENKTIVIDGSDLLYRMRLPESEGFYQDDWVAWCLMGVLAGLPEKIEPRVSGKRLILSDDEYGDLDIYRDRVVPAYMRRISKLVGRDVALEADWSGIHDGASAVRQWQRWGIHRVYGAIALACADESLGQQLRATLTKIVLTQQFGLETRYAKFEDGVLELSFHDLGGDAVGFYEQDLYAVLAGEPIEAAQLAEGEGEGLASEATSNPSLSAEDSTAIAASEAALEASNEADAAATLNDELFASAMVTMKETEATWQDQVRMFFGGREVKLELDWDSLHGRHALIQPFVHRALTGSFEALARVGFDPAYKDRLGPISRVFITSLDGEISSSVSLDNGVLTMSVGLAPYEGRAPTAELTTDLIRTLRGERHVSYGTPEPEGAAVSPAGPAGPHVAEMKPRVEDMRMATPPPKPPAAPKDRHEEAAKYMEALEAALTRNGMWPFQSKPEPLEINGAFGCNNMPFEHWLAWVLIPNVRGIIIVKGVFPEKSEVAAYAVRALDGAPGGAEIISILSDFDAMISQKGI